MACLVPCMMVQTQTQSVPSSATTMFTAPQILRSSNLRRPRETCPLIALPTTNRRLVPHQTGPPNRRTQRCRPSWTAW
jgi:hypothetical protein